MSEVDDRLRDALRGLDAVPVAASTAAETEVRARAARAARVRRRWEAGGLAVLLVAGGGVGLWAADRSSSTRPVGEVVVTPGVGPATAVVEPPTTAPVPGPVTTVDPTGVTSAPLVPIPSAPMAGIVPVTPTTLVVVELDSAPPIIAIDGIGVRIQIADPDATSGRTIRVFEATSDRELGVVAIPDDPPYFPYLRDVPVSAADLTGDGVADYLLPYGPAAQGPVGVVLSNDGGTWHLVPFAGIDGSTSDIWGFLQPRIRADGRLESMYRSCEPSCAEGLVEYRPWTYRDGVFVQDPGPS